MDQRAEKTSHQQVGPDVMEDGVLAVLCKNICSRVEELEREGDAVRISGYVQGGSGNVSFHLSPGLRAYHENASWDEKILQKEAYGALRYDLRLDADAGMTHLFWIQYDTRTGWGEPTTHQGGIRFRVDDTGDPIRLHGEIER